MDWFLYHRGLRHERVNYTSASDDEVFKITGFTASVKRKIIYKFFGKFFGRNNKICNKTGQANF